MSFTTGVRAKNTILQASELSEALGSSGIQGREPAVEALARQRLHGQQGKPVAAPSACASRSPGEESGAKAVSRSPANL